MLAEGFDAIFVGCGAPRGRDLDAPGRREAAAHIHIGIDWLASVAFGHTHSIGRRVVVLGGGNTAMDCCRTALRLGGGDVKVVVRSGFAEMKASAWEKEDAMREGVAILNYLVPKAFTHKKGRLTGVGVREGGGTRRTIAAGACWCRPASPTFTSNATTCWSPSGRRTPFPGSRATRAWRSARTGCRRSTRSPSSRACRRSSSAATRRSARRTSSPPSPTATRRPSRSTPSAATRIRKSAPPPMTNLVSQKMGIHEWSYDNAITLDRRFAVPHVEKAKALKNIKTEVELGFTDAQAFAEARRCLNCDVETVFSAPACIECDACVDICPLDCISFVPNAPEEELRQLAQRAGAQSQPGDLCLRAGQDGADHGQGRRPLPALRALRRALSDRGVGHAEVHSSKSPRRGKHANPRGKRLRHPVRQRQRLRLGERQPALRPVDHAHGRADRPAQHLSLEHPGPADLVRGAGQRGGSARRPRRRRHSRGDEPADLRSGHRGDRAGRLSLLRFDAADRAGAARATM